MTALCVGAAGPVGGQEFGVLTIDPHEGAVGSVVDGFVDPDAVAENCYTTVEEIQALFLTPPPPLNVPGPVSQDFIDQFPLVNLDSEDTIEWFFLVVGFPQPQHTQESLAAALLLLGMADGIGQDEDVAADFLRQLYILTFVDIGTQEPVGEPHNFDPNTGEGIIVVPDLDPGLWAIAATCVEPVVTEESFLAAVAAGAAVLEEHYGPFPEHQQEFPPTQDQIEEAIQLIAPAMLAELMQPQEGAGPWVDIYCVVDADGVCHPDLRDLTLAELEALEEDGLLGELLGDEVPATPVGASPRFTG